MDEWTTAFTTGPRGPIIGRVRDELAQRPRDQELAQVVVVVGGARPRADAAAFVTRFV